MNYKEIIFIIVFCLIIIGVCVGSWFSSIAMEEHSQRCTDLCEPYRTESCEEKYVICATGQPNVFYRREFE